MHLFLYSMPELRQLLVLRQNTHNSSLNAEQLTSSRPLMLSHRARCRLLVCSLACSPRKQFLFFSSHLKPPRLESLFHVSLWFCFLFHWESTTFKNNIQHTDRHSKQLFKAPVLISTCLHAVTYSHMIILPFLLNPAHPLVRIILSSLTYWSPSLQEFPVFYFITIFPLY